MTASFFDLHKKGQYPTFWSVALLGHVPNLHVKITLHPFYYLARQVQLVKSTQISE